MPEGDTIRRLAERINRRFAGERCERSVTRDPRLVHVDFAGTVLREADARGKHLLIRFDDGRTLFAHLRMDGSFTVGPAAPRGGVAAAGRAVDGDRPADRRRRARARRRRDGREDDVVGHLGPDLCGPELPDLDVVVERMAERPDEPLAGALLDQRNVAGFGNVYAVELPFVVGVSPNQPVGTVDGLPELLGLGAAVIRTNAGRGPQNTTGRRLQRRRPLDLRPARAARARCAGPASTAGTSATARGAGSPRGARACQPVEARRAVDVARARRLLALHPARREPTFPPA